MKRLIDILASGLGLLLLSPLFIILTVWIKLDSKGPVFYRQVRVGKDNKNFRIYKFRSMRTGADKGSLITIGGRDPRVTHSGYYIRKYKLDELAQLINVFIGEMSLVGPRPEVRRYVDLYTEEQKKVLTVRPGITDYASIMYMDENALLEQSSNPDKTYVEDIIPAKLGLNMKYINNPTLFEYFKLIFLTIFKIVR